MPRPQVSSGYYVYGVVATEDIPQGECLGVGDARVEYLESGVLAAAVSAILEERQVSLRKDLTAHTEVLDWLAARTTVIPMAFGTVTDDTDTVVHDVIAPGADHLIDMLDRFRGAAQFNLRGIYHRDRVLAEVVRADPALTELHRLTRDIESGQPHPDLVRLGEGVSAALERQRAHDSERVLNAVVPLVTDMRDRVVGDMDVVFDVAMLIPEALQEQVEAILEDIAASEHEWMRLQLTGPFPPYDFVEATPWVS